MILGVGVGGCDDSGQKGGEWVSEVDGGRGEERF